jgi:hypothetical protein
MVFPGKKYLTTVNHRMTVGETIYMTVQNDAFSDKFGVL